MEHPTIESLLAPGDSIEFYKGQWSLCYENEVLCRVSTLPELHAHLVQRNGNAVLTLRSLANMMKKYDAYVRYSGREFEFREDIDGEIVAKSENLEDLFEKNSCLSVAQVMDQLQVLTSLGWNGYCPPNDKVIIDIHKDTLRSILTGLAKGEA